MVREAGGRVPRSRHAKDGGVQHREHERVGPSYPDAYPNPDGNRRGAYVDGRRLEGDHRVRRARGGVQRGAGEKQGGGETAGDRVPRHPARLRHHHALLRLGGGGYQHIVLLGEGSVVVHVALRGRVRPKHRGTQHRLHAPAHHLREAGHHHHDAHRANRRIDLPRQLLQGVQGEELHISTRESFNVSA